MGSISHPEKHVKFACWKHQNWRASNQKKERSPSWQWLHGFGAPDFRNPLAKQGILKLHHVDPQKKTNIFAENWFLLEDDSFPFGTANFQGAFAVKIGQLGWTWGVVEPTEKSGQQRQRLIALGNAALPRYAKIILVLSWIGGHPKT